MLDKTDEQLLQENPNIDPVILGYFSAFMDCREEQRAQLKMAALAAVLIAQVSEPRRDIALCAADLLLLRCLPPVLRDQLFMVTQDASQQ